MTKLYLEPGEKVTLEFTLLESRFYTQKRVDDITDKLNSSNNIQEVKKYTELLKGAKNKLELINKLLDKLL